MTEDIKVSQLAGGYNRIARDLDRAISASKFNAAQRTLLDKARELSWAFRPGEPRPFRINTAELARITSYDRSYLSTQETVLVKCRVFTDNGDGTYHINKDYRDWLGVDGRPRLTDAQIEYAVSIARVPRGVGKTQHSGRLESNEVLGKPNTAEEKTQHSGRLESNEVLGKPNTAEDSSQHSPIEDRAQRPQKRIETLETPEDLPTKPAMAEAGPVGGRVGGREPDGFADVCRKADAIPTLRDVAFGPKLRGAWLQDGKLQAWWLEHPDHPAWTVALAELAGCTAEKRHPRLYLGIVKRLILQGETRTQGTAAALVEPPVSKAEARRRQISHDLRTTKIPMPKGIVE